MLNMSIHRAPKVHEAEVHCILTEVVAVTFEDPSLLDPGSSVPAYVFDFTVEGSPGLTHVLYAHVRHRNYLSLVEREMQKSYTPA